MECIVHKQWNAETVEKTSEISKLCLETFKYTSDTLRYTLADDTRNEWNKEVTMR